MNLGYCRRGFCESGSKGCADGDHTSAACTPLTVGASCSDTTRRKSANDAGGHTCPFDCGCSNGGDITKFSRCAANGTVSASTKRCRHPTNALYNTDAPCSEDADCSVGGNLLHASSDNFFNIFGLGWVSEVKDVCIVIPKNARLLIEKSVMSNIDSQQSATIREFTP